MINKINSLEYWDRRFQEDWESVNGRHQSRFFSRIAVKNLPDWLVREIKSEKLSIIDWGCALGDGTDLIKSCFPDSQVIGVDFSKSAVDDAIKHYASIEFRCEDWMSSFAESGVKYSDIVFSSNVLEHFEDWKAVLFNLIFKAEKALILALPFKEEDRDLEHFVSFYEHSFSLVLEEGFVLAWAKVVDCRDIENTRWSGDQIILVYAKADWLKALNLTLGESGFLFNDDFSDLKLIEKFGDFLKDFLRDKERLLENDKRLQQSIVDLEYSFGLEKKSLFEEISRLENDRDAFLGQLKGLEVELDNARLAISNSDLDHKNLFSEIDALTQSRDDLINKLSRLEDEINQSWQEKLSESEILLATLKQENEENLLIESEQQDRLREEIRWLDREFKQYQNEQHESLVKERLQHEENYKNQKNDLKEKIQYLDDLLGISQSKLRAIESENSELKQKCYESAVRFSDFELALSKIESDKRALEAELFQTNKNHMDYVLNSDSNLKQIKLELERSDFLLGKAEADKRQFEIDLWNEKSSYQRFVDDSKSLQEQLNRAITEETEKSGLLKMNLEESRRIHDQDLALLNEIGPLLKGLNEEVDRLRSGFLFKIFLFFIPSAKAYVPRVFSSRLNDYLKAYQVNMDSKINIEELLSLHGDEFIRKAYWCALRREPDFSGYEEYKKQLDRGVAKIDIVKQLVSSKEGQALENNIVGLGAKMFAHKLTMMPLLKLFSRGTWLDRRLNVIEERLFQIGDAVDRYIPKLQRGVAESAASVSSKEAMIVELQENLSNKDMSIFELNNILSEKQAVIDRFSLSKDLTWEQFNFHILSKREFYKGIFVQELVIDWDVPLYQRPQHIAAAFGRLGYLVIYLTDNWSGDNVDGFRQVSQNVWLTNQIDKVSGIENVVRSLYSTAYANTPERLMANGRRGTIIYEYIDHIDPKISGDEGVARLINLQKWAFSGGADYVVASANILATEAINEVGECKVILAQNGVDTRHYRNPVHNSTQLPQNLIDFKNKYTKIVGYFGALAPWLWYDVIAELTKLRPDVGFVYIGPDYYGGSEKLPVAENVLYLGTVNYQVLPAYARQFDVCFIPFEPGEIARTTSPLKLFEYFALEKPVVVTSEMLECVAFDEVFSGGSALELSQAIDQAFSIAHDLDYKRRLATLADQNDWDQRARAFEKCFDNLKDYKN